jgi:hypothetical protein
MDGGVTVETDMTDIGTGVYTIIAQTAAEMMAARSGDKFALSTRLFSFRRLGGQWQLDRQRRQVCTR